MVRVKDQTRPLLMTPSKPRHLDKVKDGKVECTEKGSVLCVLCLPT